MQAFKAKSKELRLMTLEIPREEWDAISAESREKCPKVFAKFLDRLGLPQESADEPNPD